jgi:hypothetical protein
LDTEPDPDQIDAILRSTVRLPSMLTGAALSLETPAGWARHPWLRRSKPLLFNESGQTELGGFSMQYSSELGLEVETVGRS